MKHLTLVGALLLLGTTASLSSSSSSAVASGAPASLEGDTCSEKTLRGKYGVTLEGTILSPFSGINAGPFTLVAVLDSSGAGTFKATGKANIQGVTVTQAVSGTYSVKSDCTGTATFHHPTGWDMELSFVITGTGESRQVWFMSTSQPVVSHGEGHRI